ncbi:MAG: transpeptidase family protein [Treponema sp.]|jgi:cell division protein FtsI (penicillin-binding protein 3)|nr:transpeptidase family protein [Treponema sp.]
MISEHTDNLFRYSKPPNRIRFIVFGTLIGMLGFIILTRYGYLMSTPQDIPAVNSPRTFLERGLILDRNGRILALQTRLGNVYVWRPDIHNVDDLCRDLGPIIQIPPKELRERILFSAADFIYLKKQADQSTIKEIEAARQGERLKGAGIEPIVGRIYPEKRLASQIIGFVGDENNGLAGIEYAFQEDLAPHGGNPGNHVVLTIDTNVQFILENIAQKTLVENSAEAVMLMAMDPRTGEILGSASLPDFDPNTIRSSTEQARMNRPVIWAYEPGSVFKVYSIAALLDAGAIGERTGFICQGHYERVTGLGERVTINDLSVHGPVSAREIIIYSCNTGAAYAADRLGTQSFYNRIRDFGFGAKTGVGNPGETAGFLRPSERWSERSKPTISIGQEIAVSAMQMLQASTAIANDGVLVPPRIISRILSAEGALVRNYETGTRRRIIRGETARALRSYMVDVTSNIGTGWRANVNDLSLAVKTGTAQIIDPDTGAYSDTDFLASCIAMLPSESPSLVLYLVIVKPKGEYLGGRIAAPPIREAVEALVDYLGIPRGRNPQISHTGQVSIPSITIPQVGKTIPNFQGYSKRQILPLLLRDDIRVELTGDGWVRRQTPPPGAPVNAETVILLELE